MAVIEKVTQEAAGSVEDGSENRDQEGLNKGGEVLEVRKGDRIRFKVVGTERLISGKVKSRAGKATGK